MAKSTTPKTTPTKPHEDFPLYPHPSGQWCKKLRGKAHYFGSWRTDPLGNDAHTRYLHELPYLLRNEPAPPMAGDGFPIRSVVDLWVGKKKERMEAGKISPVTYNNYYALGQAVLRHFGEDAPADVSPSGFESLRASFETRLATETLLNDMNSVISMFRLAHRKGIVSRLVDFDECFERPTALQLRTAQEASGSRMFTPEQIRQLLAAADVNMQAMILLGLNAGLGNSDISELTIDQFEKEPGWLNYPRHKTAIRRRIPLWAETSKAIKDALAKRPEPRREEDARVIFLNRLRRSYRDGRRGLMICHAFTKTAKAAGVQGTFYTLRRTFQTVADKCLDFVAVSAVMGHAPNRRDMPARYRQTVDDSRLIAATQAVHDWLFKRDGANGAAKPKRRGAK